MHGASSMLRPVAKAVFYDTLPTKYVTFKRVSNDTATCAFYKDHVIGLIRGDKYWSASVPLEEMSLEDAGDCFTFVDVGDGSINISYDAKPSSR